MRNLWTILLLLGSLAWAQAQQPAPAPTPASPAVKHADDDDDKPKSSRRDDDDDKEAKKPTKIGPNTSVLTINGLCNKPAGKAGVKPASAKAAACETPVSRDQFEKLVLALMPEMSPQTKRQFANTYPRLLVMAHEAQVRGLDKTARAEQILAFARLQVLSQELVRSFKEEAAKVPESAITDYYNANAANYEQVSVERIFVPLRKQETPSSQLLSPADQEAQQRVDADEMKKVAEALRARAAAGEDFTKLQQEAYDAANFKTTAAPAAVQKLRRGQLAASQVAIFNLKPGDVSPVYDDPGGHTIYKVTAKGEQPLSEVHKEIHDELQSERLRALMDKVDHSFTTDVNQAYFEDKKPNADEDED